MTAMPRFPDGFHWGVATSAFQIEGALDADGRGRSVWDTFTATPGKIRDGHTAATACDHYRRFGEDIDLMRRLGIDVYRFSIAWPRVFPDGHGKVNTAGLDFYDRLVDALLAANLTPMPTLFHWDLPQSLEDAGGWLNRDTAAHFADYASTVAQRLGDRVNDWITLNEPFEHMALGYALGQHAPGHMMLLESLPVAHHQLLGHGLATARLRAAGAKRVLLTNSYTPVEPATASEADAAAAAAYDALHRGLFTDPVVLGRYPDLSAFGADELPFVHDDDLDVIATPLDGLGVNYYAPTKLAAAVDGPLPFTMTEYPDADKTAFDWPVVPDGMRRILVELTERYGDALPPLWVTENGCSFPDGPGDDGAVHDDRRISYLDSHIRAVHDAIEQGADVRGYLTWTLCDNFEWAEGYHQRFGLVHVDHDTQKRTPKDSFAWFAGMLAEQRA
ncbi:GH1 family beta-glucosidase [Stackebrandtia nassauensis]|uniref:Beta-glucosidase n=1 Tax=Stackebrandtia nassauensis (strain DSM 44728 / CIP 108903 / NRRL B-16338 / NBRC 102104 / LLR-40K-21) TaxID=446470 RepID=D3Q2J6_STANL|nr:GH1 family beta-glucosidase [Stackebrandtia nassauensis]ADD43929.1 beta-galactosidase [Stackebrandtia nassauensis DSM 44728]